MPPPASCNSISEFSSVGQPVPQDYASCSISGSCRTLIDIVTHHTVILCLITQHLSRAIYSISVCIAISTGNLWFTSGGPCCIWTVRAKWNNRQRVTEYCGVPLGLGHKGSAANTITFALEHMSGRFPSSEIPPRRLWKIEWSVPFLLPDKREKDYAYRSVNRKSL